MMLVTTAATVPTTRTGAPVHGVVRDIPYDQWQRLASGEPPVGMSVRNDDPRSFWGGTLVSTQTPDDATVAQGLRSFTRYYGATTRANLALGDIVGTTFAGTTEAGAIESARKRTLDVGSKTLAVVREGERLVMRELLVPNNHSPYFDGSQNSEPRAGSLTWMPSILTKDPAHLMGITFRNDAVRAIVEYGQVFRNR